jgi:hypothetical protein
MLVYEPSESPPIVKGPENVGFHNQAERVLSLSLIMICSYVDRGNTGCGSNESTEEGAVLQINSWRIVSCSEIDPIRRSKKGMVIQKIIIKCNS